MGITTPTSYGAFKDLVREVKFAKKNNGTNYPFTIAFSNWVNGFENYSLNITEAKFLESPIFRCGRGMELSILSQDGRPILEKVQVVGTGNTKRDAHETCFKRLVAKILRIGGIDFTQMDSLTTDGEIVTSPVTDRESNVILETAAEGDNKQVINISSAEINKQLSSTESTYDMVKDGYSLVNRWYPLQMVKIDTTTVDVFSLRIPEALYADSSSVNLIPLRGFIYGDLDVEFKLVVNAAQFHQGRLIMGAFYCAQGFNRLVAVPKWYAHTSAGASDYRYENLQTQIDSIYGMVQRPHVLCDMASSTSASLLVKYNYNKPFVRLLDYANNKTVNPGVLGGYFVNLSAKMLVPLSTADDNPKEVNCTLYYRFVKANLTGMTRQHDLTQMDVLDLGLSAAEAITGLAHDGIGYIRKVERQLLRKGKIFSNRDKPSDVFGQKVVVPRPRMHFPNGVGLADPVILGVDTLSATTHYEDPGYGPTSYIEYARIPGIDTIVTWSLSDIAKKQIFQQIVVPYSSHQNQTFDTTTGLFPLATKMDSVPLHIATNGFMYWGGTICYEFDIVKTNFHKGSILISVSYGKETNDKIGSNYEKIVDIQETSKIKVTVPYIYDTVARRTHNFSYVTAWGQLSNWQPDALPTYSRTKITLTVLNPLIDIGSVANSVKIIVWKYAGEDFFLSSPTQVNNIMSVPVSFGDRDFNRLLTFPVNEDHTAPTTAEKYTDVLPPASFPAGKSARTSTTREKTQMDAQDFTPGPVDHYRMHSGNETSFKNLLRVPIRIIASQHINADQTLCLPVMPLTTELIYNYLPKQQRLAMTHQHQITKMFRMWRGSMRYTIILHNATTHPVFITFLPSDGTFKKLIRPKNFNDRYHGATWSNTKRFFSSVDDEAGSDLPDLSGTGHPTTVLCSTVNPTEMVEVQWTLPVNWALMDQGGRYTQHCWRDISFTNNGHICVYCDGPVEVSIFMSVGDDFEMAAFCGLTDYTPSFVLNNRMDDARQEKTQMDFYSCESSSDAEFIPKMVRKTRRAVKRNQFLVKPAIYGVSTVLPSPFGEMVRQAVVAHTIYDLKEKVSSASAAITENISAVNVSHVVHAISGASESIQSGIEQFSTKTAGVDSTLEELRETLGGTRRMQDKVTNTFGKADHVLTDLGEVLAGVKKTVDTANELLDEVQAQVDGGLFDWVKTLFGGLSTMSGVWDSLKSVFQKLYDAILGCDIVVAVRCLVESLYSLGLTTKEYVTRKLGYLTELFGKILKQGTDETQSGKSTEEKSGIDKGDVQTLLGLLFGGVLTVYGASCGQQWQKGHSGTMARWVDSFAIGKGLMTMNGSFLFVRNVYSTLSKMVSHVLGLSDPQIKIRQLLIDNPSIVSDFVHNAQLFLNNYNDIVAGDVATKSRFWITICNAYQIRACFAKIEGNSTMNVLKELCREVIKKANENTSLFQSTAVRYEPYVICLEGQTGIGKSFLTAEISSMCLGNIGLKMDTIDYRYVVNPGVDYWNLYNGQPVIVYDDWCNLVDTQSIRKDISELYQLKTSNVMNAPKAELSEKKTVVNPFVVLMATNNPFPSTNTLVNTAPLYRRRDVLVKVQLVNKDMDRSNPANYESYKHLQFGVYDSVLQPQSQFSYKTWAEFRAWLKEDHMKYHLRESSNVKKRIEILSQALTEQALVNADIADPFTLQARALHQVESQSEKLGVVRSLPSEMLEFQVREIVELIKANYKVVKTEGSLYYIQDANAQSHTEEVPTTQIEGASSLFTYFTAPVVKTYEMMRGYMNKWMMIGMRCGTCSSPPTYAKALLTCAVCSKISCGMCIKSIGEQAQCVCGGAMVIRMPKIMEILISLVLSAAFTAIAPMSKTEVVIMSLFKLVTGWDVLVPFSVLAAIRQFIRPPNHRFSGPINVTQMGSKKGARVSSQPPSDSSFEEVAAETQQEKEKSIPIPLEPTIKVLPQNDNINDILAAEPEPLLDFKLPDLSPSVDRELDANAPCVPPDYVLSSAFVMSDPPLEKCCHGKLDPKVPILSSTGGTLHLCSPDWVGRIPLGPCNTTDCKWSLLNLRATVDKCFSINRLSYIEIHQAIKNGAMAAENYSDIPYVYLPAKARELLKEDIAEATTGPSWWAWLFGKLAKYSTLGAIFYLVAKAGICIFSSLLGLFGSVTQAEGSFDHERMARQFNRSRKIGRTQGEVTQAADTEMYTKAKDKICANYVVFSTPNLRSATGIGLYGSTVLIPKHYIPPLQKAETITVTFFGAKHESIQLNPANMSIKMFPDKDCALLTLSKAIYFADIRKFFMQDKEYDEYDESKGEIVVLEFDHLTEYPITLLNIVDGYSAYDELTGHSYETKDAIDYSFERRGACGSVIFSRNAIRPIIGIHIAGNYGSGKGTGARIRATELSSEVAFDMAPMPFQLMENCTDFGDDVNVEYIGKLPPDQVPYCPTKTGLTPSLINECFETPTVTQPAILSKNDPRYTQDATPLIHGVRKHGKPTLDFDRALVQASAQFWQTLLLQKKWGFEHKVQIYSIEAAALGRPEVIGFYDWLPDDTSAGWPYNTILKEVNGVREPATKKKHWMKYQRDPTTERPVSVEFDPLLIEHYNRDMEYRRQGILAPIVFQDVLKDEKRKVEKILKAGGTRVISMSPVTASLALRQYTLDFTSHLRYHRISNWIAIGINPDGPEWGILARRLLSKGNNMFTIDFTNFGPGLNADVAFEFSNMLHSFYEMEMGDHYTQEDKLVTTTLIRELVNSVHMAGGTVYRTKAGSPSGAAITVEINSFVHLMYLTMSWQIIARILRYQSSAVGNDEERIYRRRYSKAFDYLAEHNEDKNLHTEMAVTFDDFLANVTGVVYGDDGLFSVTDKYKAVFNAKVIQLVLGAHGIVATDANKGEQTMTTGPLQNMSFLKRSFIPHPVHANQWAAPMDIDVVTECARWIHKSGPEETMTLTNVQASLLLSYGHGPHFYNNWKKQLDQFLRRVDLPAVYLTWEDLDRIFYPDYYLQATKQDPFDILAVRRLLSEL
ncbi:hypothetical protein [Hubei picorna-like virus 36]|uniref:hypothetical protein n=1 Tax=Hubei picorna-like virus 36 TaxID=1923116 RepID=UPI00090B9D24|nr:hypothetical protein [Hubei picorna-like virus 36]APG78033.1 hypothetical protein [Hubei picorna-like virus 36]